MAPRKKNTAKPETTSIPTGLPASALGNPCDPNSLGFENSNELPDLQDVIGQPRALRALELGSGVGGPGYNIYVLGIPGSGRTTLSREYLERKARTEPVPDDWCYVNNFEDPHKPKALRLPAGQASELRKELTEFINRCKQDIPRLFENEEYIHERDRLINEMKKRQENEFLRLQEHVEKYNFAIVRAPFGFVLVPAVEGKPLKPEEVENLTQEQRTKLSELQSKLGEEVEKSLSRLREQEKVTSQQLKDLNRGSVLFMIGPVLAGIKARFSNQAKVIEHLEAVQADIIENANRFRSEETGEVPTQEQLISRRDWELRYEVNVLVDNSKCTGAPVVIESYPSYANLLGRIEHEAMMGASRTDFTMIRPGGLHRANGGYLLIPARDVLINPYAWEGLKRVLRDRELRIIELANQIGLLSQSTLEPEPIPLNVKVLLVGTPMLYYLLRAYDEDFAKLFKVRAEFATAMDRTPDTEAEYGLFVRSVVEDNQLPPFDKSAVARIIEYSSRLAEDQRKLSTRFGKIADLIREAAFWAKKDAQEIVQAGAVTRAIEESIYRNNLIEERIQELIDDNTLMIDITGAVAGQVNALAVFSLGDYNFGRPSRVTAITYPGKGGVLDIERQAKLGGSLHTKGVLILNGYMNGKYGRGQPLSLSASLTFEQTYEEIQGDSASAAELFALLSSITGIPLRQDRAVTGSINQRGQVQAVGGINEKVEGFFATCKSKGLTGEQGVLIPSANVRNLMLRDEVVQAVADGRFHVWAISTIDEGIPLLTGYPEGLQQADGSYPEGSFNYKVVTSLAEFTRAMQATPKNATPSAETNEKPDEKIEDKNDEQPVK